MKARDQDMGLPPDPFTQRCSQLELPYRSRWQVVDLHSGPQVPAIAPATYKSVLISWYLVDVGWFRDRIALPPMQA